MDLDFGEIIWMGGVQPKEQLIRFWWWAGRDPYSEILKYSLFIVVIPVDSQ